MLQSGLGMQQYHSLTPLPGGAGGAGPHPSLQELLPAAAGPAGATRAVRALADGGAPDFITTNLLSPTALQALHAVKAEPTGPIGPQAAPPTPPAPQGPQGPLGATFAQHFKYLSGQESGVSCVHPTKLRCRGVSTEFACPRQDRPYRSDCGRADVALPPSP